MKNVDKCQNFLNSPLRKNSSLPSNQSRTKYLQSALYTYNFYEISTGSYFDCVFSNLQIIRQISYAGEQWHFQEWTKKVNSPSEQHSSVVECMTCNPEVEGSNPDGETAFSFHTSNSIAYVQ